jgi:hypothetical protein
LETGNTEWINFIETPERVRSKALPSHTVSLKTIKLYLGGYPVFGHRRETLSALIPNPLGDKPAEDTINETYTLKVRQRPISFDGKCQNKSFKAFGQDWEKVGSTQIPFVNHILPAASMERSSSEIQRAEIHILLPAASMARSSTMSISRVCFSYYGRRILIVF